MRHHISLYITAGVIFALLVSLWTIALYYLTLPAVQTESFRPLRLAYNRTHKAARRGLRPYIQKLQNWALPYRRMLV